MRTLLARYKGTGTPRPRRANLLLRAPWRGQGGGFCRRYEAPTQAWCCAVSVDRRATQGKSGSFVARSNVPVACPMWRSTPGYRQSLPVFSESATPQVSAGTSRDLIDGGEN